MTLTEYQNSKKELSRFYAGQLDRLRRQYLNAYLQENGLEVGQKYMITEGQHQGARIEITGFSLLQEIVLIEGIVQVGGIKNVIDTVTLKQLKRYEKH
jgi:hypothetical protein